MSRNTTKDSGCASILDLIAARNWSAWLSGGINRNVAVFSWAEVNSPRENAWFASGPTPERIATCMVLKSSENVFHSGESILTLSRP